MENLLKLLGQAGQALDAATSAYAAFEEARETLSSDDQAKLKTKLAELQLKYDGLHDKVQAKLRG